MPGIDLHTHSTASDGSLTPTELVNAAKAAGLVALGLTDHDTTAGLAEASSAGEAAGLEVVLGCELSATTDTARMHLLGLWLPSKPSALEAAMTALNEHRHERNHIIIAKLRELGLDIDYPAVRDFAGEGSVGRPHIAALLLQRGQVRSMEEAFERYLGSRGKAYAPKRVLSAQEAIDLLKSEGATVILAHPYQCGLGGSELEAEVLRLKGLGLDGLEAYYNDHTPSRTAAMLHLAKRLDLLVSGGSDFHGAAKPDIRLGSGRGSLRVPLEVLDALKEARVRQGLPI